jgi:hypothetical protein
MLTATALIASVFLNGVNIDGLRGQSFEKCRAVKIDDNGDVHLDCPAYQVEQAPAAQKAQPAAHIETAAPKAVTASTTASLSKHYWLVAEQTAECAALVDVEIFLNASRLRSVKQAESQSGVDITPKVKAGKNSLTVLVSRKAGADGAAQAACGRVFIGSGTEAAGSKAVVEDVVRDHKLAVPASRDETFELAFEAR